MTAAHDTTVCNNEVRLTPEEISVCEVWENWFLALRAVLHDAVHEELSGSETLNDFFDVHGLAYERSYGHPILLDFLQKQPARPANGSMAVKAAEFNRIALSEEPLMYPLEKLPAVSQALRDRAEALGRLADQIDGGTFKFPRWEE